VTLRQFNLVTIYMDAMPAPAQVGDKQDWSRRPED